jgi:perosamine synthetase
MSLDQVANLFSDPVRVVPLLNDRGEVVDLAVFDQRMHLPIAGPLLGERELLYVTECVLTGWVSSAGKFVTRFEQMFEEFCGCRYAIATSSGTTALHLALLSHGIGPGDEVIVPTLTFIATANAVTYTGARPVFLDSEITTWNIDPDKIEEAITPRTKAIIPVHLYGHPADMDRILNIAAKHGLVVIEDAAEAHGATYKGRKVGGIGDLGVFSFYGNKIITTGEGGMVVTNDAKLAEKIKILRDHGMSKNRRYWHPVLGYNYRLTNIQAAIGVAQMENIDNILAAKRTIANTYKRLLRGVTGISLPPSAPWAGNVFWLYSILIDEQVCNVDRNIIIENLSKNGIETRPLFPPIHTQPIYNTGQSLPVSEMLFQKGLCLPSSANLHEDEIIRTVNIIKESISS